MAKVKPNTNVKNPTKDQINAATNPILALINSAPVGGGQLEMKDDSLEVTFPVPGSIMFAKVQGLVFNGVWIARVELPSVSTLDEATTNRFGQLVQTLMALQSVIGGI